MLLKLEEIYNKANYSDEENRARDFAKIYHDASGATRRGSGDPYIVHPEGVASILKAFTNDEILIQAAFMHDLIEDTPVDYDQIVDEINEESADIVNEVSTIEDEKKRFGKQNAIDRELLIMSDRALSLKLADNIYNYSDKAGKDQKERIRHHVAFIKENRKLKKIHKELIEILESLFEYI